MGIDRPKFHVVKNGDLSFDPNWGAYVGGSPAAVNEGGKLVRAKYANLALAKSDATGVTYVGVFINTSTVDGNHIEKKAAYYLGAGVFTLTKLKESQNNLYTNPGGGAGVPSDDYPYDTNITFKPKDNIFVDLSGLWTNANPEAGKPTFGVVLAVLPGALVVQFYGQPSAIF